MDWTGLGAKKAGQILSEIPTVCGTLFVSDHLCFWQVGLAHFGRLIWPTLGR
jgi:hypothetical protein